VEFGDGRHGKIPLRGRNNITATYRVGGGAKGNAPARTIVQTVTPIDQLKLVYNEDPATGGADAETSEEAVLRGPQLFRAQDRAVTARDYEAHAKAFGVAKARARAANWNTIELFVAPVGGGRPTDTLKEDLRRYLDSKRIMTSIVEIGDPVYVNVCVGGNLEIDAYYFTEQVQQRVSNAIAQLLAFERVDFEATLYLSKVYEAIEGVEGVRYVNVTRFSPRVLPEEAPPEALPSDGRLRFAWREIPYTEPVNWHQDPATGVWTWQSWRLDTPC
jgi:predicted phage baseplate assembly protein